MKMRLASRICQQPGRARFCWTPGGAIPILVSMTRPVGLLAVGLVLAGAPAFAQDTSAAALFPALPPSKSAFAPLTDSTRVYGEGEVDSRAVPLPMSGTPNWGPPHSFPMKSATVLAQFVVDRAGRADVSTFTVLVPADSVLVKRAREVVPHMRFRPALLHGEPVKQVWRQMISVYYP
jgi:hypothetical protein